MIKAWRAISRLFFVPQTQWRQLDLFTQQHLGPNCRTRWAFIQVLQRMKLNLGTAASQPSLPWGRVHQHPTAQEVAIYIPAKRGGLRARYCSFFGGQLIIDLWQRRDSYSIIDLVGRRQRVSTPPYIYVIQVDLNWLTMGGIIHSLYIIFFF